MPVFLENGLEYLAERPDGWAKSSPWQRYLLTVMSDFTTNFAMPTTVKKVCAVKMMAARKDEHQST